MTSDFALALLCLGAGGWLAGGRQHSTSSAAGSASRSPSRSASDPLRRQSRGGARRRQGRSVALLLDLVATALTSGLAVETAFAAVSRCVERGNAPELTTAMRPLSEVGRLIAWGAEPQAAWLVAEQHRGYEAAAAAGRRCAGSGARLAEALATAARSARAECHLAAMLRANRVGVWSLLPLGFCFLPAFVCLGIVPVVGGIGVGLLSNTAP